MKTFFCIALSAIMFLNVTDIYSQVSSSNQWTWIGGDNAVNSFGVYGQKGVESPTNKPGARRGASNWVDAAGNLWLFAGWGYAVSAHGYLNDLWKYNLTTNQWTWVAGDSVINGGDVVGALGTEGIGYTPSARANAAYWTDATGTNLYLFGGQASVRLVGDVWSFNTVSNKWKWVKSTIVDSAGNCRGQAYGSAGTFTPGVWPLCRTYATAASAGSIAYIFGGSTNTAFMNDLYQFADINYSSAPNQWAYLKFTEDLSQAGRYTGENTKPGCRMNIMNFVKGNNYYVFGGYGIGYGTSGIQSGWSNDLWRYDGLDVFTQKPVWTWIKGDSIINSPGNYGTLGVANLTNNPPSRSDGAIRPVGNGRFILFGGGSNLNGTLGFYNDLWTYDVSSNNWTWIGGYNFINSSGYYGAKGVQQLYNMISGRGAQTCWLTASGDMYIFGGYNNGGDYNDLWKFSKPLDLISVNNVNTTTLCPGTQLTITYKIHLQASNPFTDNNNFIAELSDTLGQFTSPVIIGTVQSKVSGTITATIPLNTAAGTQYKIRVRSTSPYYASQPYNTPISITITKPTITAGGSTTIVCPTTSVTLTSSAASAYLWNTGETTQSIVANTGGSYTVTTTKANGCQNISEPAVVTCANTPALKAYITNSGGASVSVINTNSNSVIATIPVSNYPDAVVVSPDGNKAYITYYDPSNTDNKVTIINAKTNKVTGSVKVNNSGTHSDGIDISPDGKKLYIAYPSFSSTSDTVFVANTTTNAIINKIVLPSQGYVEGIAVSSDGSKVYASGDGISVINAATNTLQTTILAGNFVYGIAVNPTRPRLYASYGSPQLFVINTNNNSVVTAVPFPAGSHVLGIAVSPDDSKVYAANYTTSKVYVINTNTNAIADSIAVNLRPYGIDITPDGSKVYVAGSGSNTVAVINTSNNSVIANVPVGNVPIAFGKFIGRVPCVAAKPTVTASGPVTDICPGETITLTSSPAHIYYWNNGTTAQSNIISNTGNYAVKITDINGCQNTSDTAVVTYLNCSAPAALSTKNITSTSATLNWTAFDCASGYKVQYRIKGITAWTTAPVITTNTPKLNLTGLTANTIYQWHVASRCSNNGVNSFSAYSASKQFTTSAIAFVVKADDVKQSTSNFTVYPNPARQNATVVFNVSKAGYGSIQISDITGKILYRARLTVFNGSNRHIINIGGFAQGVYLITLTRPDNTRQSIRINKE